MPVSTDGAYSEVCLVGLTVAGGSEVQYASLIEEFTPSQGDKTIATVSLTNGGRIVKKTPQGDNEVTLKLYEISTKAANSLALMYQGTTDASAPYTTTNTRTRNRIRAAFLWTDDSAATTASGSTASGSAARRLVITELRMTSYKASWEDKTLVHNVTLTGPAFKQDASATITEESVEAADAAGLSALSSYS
jgi:hypothetical protein